MQSISIGVAKNTTGLLGSSSEEYRPPTIGDTTTSTTSSGSNSGSAPFGNNRWIGGSTATAAASAPASSSFVRDAAVSAAGSVASATAGALVMGASAATRSIATAAKNKTKTSSWTPWSSNNNNNAEEIPEVVVPPKSTGPSWSTTSSSAMPAMGRNSDYGVNDDDEQANNSGTGLSATASSWKSSILSPFRRTQQDDDVHSFRRPNQTEGSFRPPTIGTPDTHSSYPIQQQQQQQQQQQPARNNISTVAMEAPPELASSPRWFQRRKQIPKTSDPSISTGSYISPQEHLELQQQAKDRRAEAERLAAEEQAAMANDLKHHKEYYTQHLLTQSPSTITFVVRCNHSEFPVPNQKGSCLLKESRQRLLELIGVKLAKNQTKNRFEVVRDDFGETTTTTNTKDNPAESDDETIGKGDSSVMEESSIGDADENGESSSSIGDTEIGNDDGESSIVDNGNEDRESTTPSPLLPPELTVLLRPGDILESVNNKTIGGKRLMNQCKDEETLYRRVIASADWLNKKRQKHNPDDCSCYYTTTLTFACGGGAVEDDGSELDASEHTVEKSTAAPLSIHQAYFVDKTKGFQRSKCCSNDEAMMDDENDNFLQLKTEAKIIGHRNPDGRKPTSLSLLHIESIPDNNWLVQQNRIQAGHVLLSVDETPCCNGELTTNDLSLIWRTALLTKVADASSSTIRYVGLKTFRRPLTRLQSIRKTAVAVGGGALVGTGAVLMATPLHPVGHAMTIGGLGVLGTEFEGPKNAVKSVRRSLTNLRQTKKKEDESSSSSSSLSVSPKVDMDAQ